MPEMFVSTFLSHLKKFDWLLLAAVLLLITIGLLSLFSLSGVSLYPFFGKQILWALIGIVLLVVLSFFDFRILKMHSFTVFLFYLLTVFLLLLVLLLRLKIRGIEAWLSIGGFFFQPVELAKLSLIVLLAKFFSKRHIEIYRLRHLIVSALYMALPVFLVLLQPDLGSAIVLIFIWFVIIVFSGMKPKHLLLFAVLGILIISIVWSFGLHPYQKARIIAFFNPYEDPKGAGYQMIQSMIAVGSGQIWGKGLGYGSQSHLNFLPEPETDFIFAAYAEEWGFVGTIMLLALFLIILWRIIRIGMMASDNFSRLYSFGFAALIFVQSFIHIGMNMGVLPITGITLPFVSYGGSSLVTLLIGVAILQNIKINARREIKG